MTRLVLCMFCVFVIQVILMQLSSICYSNDGFQGRGETTKPDVEVVDRKDTIRENLPR